MSTRNGSWPEAEELATSGGVCASPSRGSATGSTSRISSSSIRSAPATAVRSRPSTARSSTRRAATRSRSRSSFASIATASTPTTRRSSSAGESYGVTRAAAVADVLERRGTRVSGAVLIGLALPLGSTTAEQRTRTTCRPTRQRHSRTASSAQICRPIFRRRCARPKRGRPRDMKPALARRDALSDAERAEVVGRSRALHRIRREPDRSQDADDPDAAVQRATAARREPHRRPLRQPAHGAVRSAAGEDVRPAARIRASPTSSTTSRCCATCDHELGFESDLPYQGPFGGGYPPPDGVSR